MRLDGIIPGILDLNTFIRYSLQHFISKEIIDVFLDFKYKRRKKDGLILESLLLSLIQRADIYENSAIFLGAFAPYLRKEEVTPTVFNSFLQMKSSNKTSILIGLAHCELSFYQLHLLNQLRIDGNPLMYLLDFYTKQDIFSEYDFQQFLYDNKDQVQNIEYYYSIEKEGLNANKRKILISFLKTTHNAENSTTFHLNSEIVREILSSKKDLVTERDCEDFLISILPGWLLSDDFLNSKFLLNEIKKLDLLKPTNQLEKEFEEKLFVLLCNESHKIPCWLTESSWPIDDDGYPMKYIETKTIRKEVAKKYIFKNQNEEEIVVFQSR